MFCQKCGKEIPDGSAFCGECGTKAGGDPQLKFCKHCGAKITADAVMCVHCGRQVEELKQQSLIQPQIVINNDNINTNTNAGINTAYDTKMKNKWIAFLLCLFLGWLGIHKFYEEKILMGVLYLFTFGLFGFGILVDLILILCKPNPYFV